MRKIIDVIYVCACGPPGGGRNHVTARFYRHFNIVSYVDMSDDSLGIIFSTILSNYLSPFESNVVGYAQGIVKATIDMYSSIIEELRPTPTKPHYTFNMRDISKVFQGMLMKKKVTSSIDLGRLWLHEVRRVFGDRLISEADKQWLQNTTETKLDVYTDIGSASLWATSPDVIYADFMTHNVESRLYDEVVDLPTLQEKVKEYLEAYNSTSRQPMEGLVLFKDVLMHVAKISRILRQPSGHALLLGVGGSGRQSLTKLAASIAEYKLCQITISKGYGAFYLLTLVQANPS
jgi:dynein heavy chain